MGLDVALEENDVLRRYLVGLHLPKVSCSSIIFKLTSDKYLNRKNQPTKHSLFLLQVRQIIEPVPPFEGQNPLNPAAQTLGPIMNAEAIQDWKIKDCTVPRILLATIELKLQNTLVRCKTAFQIWTQLNSEHNKCAANNKYVVQQNFRSG
jgi:hypothetical protein